MEKNYAELLNLNGVSHETMLCRIKMAVRRVAKDIPAFRDSHNGCIRITLVPLSLEGEKWLGGGLSDNGYFRQTNESSGEEELETCPDVCEREFVFKIDPRGSHTIKWIDLDDGHIELVNCYAYSALKTAWVSWKMKMRDKAHRGEIKSLLGDKTARCFIEENGWSQHEGSVYTTISVGGEDFLRLYVCVSGADASEDKQCALAGMLAAQELFRYPVCKDVEFDPYIVKDLTPIEQIWRDDEDNKH